MQNPGRLNTRTQLIETAHRLSPSRACQRAIYTGHVEVLGGFKIIPPWNRPGWICRVISGHGKAWLLTVMVDEIKHGFICGVADEVPWDQWDGAANRDGHSIYDGDHPHANAVEHLLALWGLGSGGDHSDDRSAD